MEIVCSTQDLRERYGFFVFTLSSGPSQKKGMLMSLKISQVSNFNMGALLISCSVNLFIPCLFIPLNRFTVILGRFSCRMRVRVTFNSIF